MKKHVTKSLTVGLTVLMMISTIMSGCGGQANEKSSKKEETSSEKSTVNKEGFPIVDDSITLTVYGSRDQNHAAWKDMKMLQEYEKKTNIHMDYQEVSADGFAENLSLLFASNELPDIILRSALSQSQITKYGVSSKQLMQLDKLLEKYAPNFNKLCDEYPEIKQNITASDGHIYALPGVDLSESGKINSKQFLNKKWLDKLGLKEPTTIDEMKTVLTAFKTQDPNGNGEQDEIPMNIRQTSYIFKLGGSFGLQHQLNDTYNLDDNGELHNWLVDDNYKEYLKYMHDLYSEGLLYEDFYKNDIAKYRSLLTSGAFGLFYAPYTDGFINIKDDYEGFEPLLGPTNEKLWSDQFSPIYASGEFALSSTCKNPEAAIRWVDYFYGEEGEMMASYGLEGVSYKLDSNGTPQITDELLNDETGFMTALGKINMVPGGGFPCLRTDKTQGIVADEKTIEASKKLTPYLCETYYWKPSVAKEDADRALALEQDLTKYRDETAVNFIVGKWDIDEKWNEYCSTMKKLHIDELTEIYQRAIDKIADK